MNTLYNIITVVLIFAFGYLLLLMSDDSGIRQIHDEVAKHIDNPVQIEYNTSEVVVDKPLPKISNIVKETK